MRVVVIYRKRRKQLKKIAPHLKSTSARTPTYSRAYSEMLSTASPDNLVALQSPDIFFLLVQPLKKLLEESTTVKEAYFLTIFFGKLVKKIRFKSNLESKTSLPYTLLNMFWLSSDMHHFEACRKHYTLENAKLHLKFHFPPKIDAQNLLEKSESLWVITECNLPLILHCLTSIGMSHMGF